MGQQNLSFCRWLALNARDLAQARLDRHNTEVILGWRQRGVNRFAGKTMWLSQHNASYATFIGSGTGQDCTSFASVKLLQALFRRTERRRESPARAMAAIFSDLKASVDRGDSSATASCALGDIQ
jgi:hypothetical protein